MPILLERGADIDSLDLTGRTAIYSTIQLEAPNEYLFNLFLDRGTNFRLLDRLGDTLLNHVISNRYLKGMRRLVSMGANVNARNLEGRSPLHIAAGNGFAEGVDYLLTSCFVDPNVWDNHLQTPLHVVLQKASGMDGEDYKRLPVVYSLLRASADWTLRNSGGESPIGLAGKLRYIPIEITEALGSAQWYRENGPASIWLKPGPDNAVVQLPRLIDNVSCFETFKIGMLRAKAARFFNVPAITINMQYKGHSLADDTRSCMQEGLVDESIVDCYLGPSVASATSTGYDKEKSEKQNIEMSRPTYIKVHRKHLSPETLDAYKLPWEWWKVCSLFIDCRSLIVIPNFL